MEEQLEEIINKDMFLTPKEQLGYSEDYIFIKFGDKNNGELLNYSLSNKLDDIEIAILNRTGHIVKLKNAQWKIAPELSLLVKQLMNKYNVKYSMTTMQYKKVPQIIVNMRTDDIWLTAGFEEFDGKFISWNRMEYYRAFIKLIKKYFPKEDDDDDD